MKSLVIIIEVVVKAVEEGIRGLEEGTEAIMVVGKEAARALLGKASDTLASTKVVVRSAAARVLARG